MYSYNRVRTSNKNEYRNLIWKHFVRENYQYFEFADSSITHKDARTVEGNDNDNFYDVSVTKDGVVTFWAISKQEMNELLDQFDELDEETKEEIYSGTLESYLHTHLKFTKEVQ